MGAQSSDSRKELVRRMEKKWLEYRNMLRVQVAYYYWVPEVRREGLVLDTLYSTYDGIRTWPEDVWPTDTAIKQFLLKVLRSKASHLWEKESVKAPRGKDAGEDKEAEKPHRIRRQKDIDAMDEIALNKQGLFRTDATQQKIEDQQFFKILCKHLGADQNLIRICALYIKYRGIKPNEIAEAVGIPMDEMRNAQKRLRRILSKLKEQR